MRAREIAAILAQEFGHVGLRVTAGPGFEWDTATVYFAVPNQEVQEAVEARLDELLAETFQEGLGLGTYRDAWPPRTY